MSSEPYRSLSAPDLSRRLADDPSLRVIDVREPFEWDIAHLARAELRPLSEIRTWWVELDRAEEIVFYCHHGNRSASVCRALAAEGFSELVNLEGGIDAWSLTVDTSLPRY